MKKYFLLLIFLFSAVVLYAQHQVETIFPYRMVGGKIIIDMKMNGQIRSFIFDTGGQTALTEEICDELSLPQIDDEKITDVNGSTKGYKRVIIHELKDVNDKFSFKNVPAIVIPAKSAVTYFHVDGIIGSNVLRYSIVELDGKSKQMRIFVSGVLPSIRKMLPFVQTGFMPIINIQLGKTEMLPVLFDTGCPAFLNLKDSDFSVLQDRGLFKLKNKFYTEGSLGLNGKISETTSYRVLFPLLSIGSAHFKNVDSETSSSPLTLLGVKLLNYGKVTIDYPQSRFYFELYEDKEHDLTSTHYLFTLTVKDGNLCVSSVDESLKSQLTIGDKVLKINGKSVRKYSFGESIISGIPDLKKKKVNKLIIQTQNGPKEFTYKKQ